ncbi:MAG TPA: 50S ribosomal protein L4 [Micropepsaceae bacterium]|nr:50S ribosomal protein L4 [Micropepsaceae bacterium]HRK71878.1 50S ribosomal protein L4 [Micropepsaceae bacterium]
MKATVKSLSGTDAGTIELKDDIFGLEPRADILHRVVNWQLAKRRAGTHKTLTRAEVNKTKKKSIKQKGSGGARHGARNVPQYRGGGRAMGPVVRSHAYDLPKKIRSLGLKLALSAKQRDNKLVVVDAATVPAPKTKEVAQAFKKLGVASALVVDGAFDAGFERAARNIANVTLLPAAGLNVYDILRRDTLVITRDAISKIEERLS